MLRRIQHSDPAAQPELMYVCDRATQTETKVVETVETIINEVRERGDDAVVRYTRRFDQREPNSHGSYEIPPENWQTAAQSLDQGVKDALKYASQKISAFHELQIERGYETETDGIQLAMRVAPMQRIGIYVPGGTALYPSSVLMTAIPARIAGVREIIMVTPGASPATLAAAQLAGVSRVFEIGGAQAVAALAYGTNSIPRVDKIVGPGNKWVATAKRIVFGDVDIDSIAGPSEVLIIADESANPEWVAADLLAQAEHDRDARPILVTTSETIVDAVDAALARQLPQLDRNEIARESLSRFGVAIIVDDVASAIDVANRYAPEHLELQIDNARERSKEIHTAGAIFVGNYSPEATGDYVAGPNHVLPTAGAARYAAPLGVYDFYKRTSILEYSAEALHSQIPHISRIAKIEGLEAHARSVELRKPVKK